MIATPRKRTLRLLTLVHKGTDLAPNQRFRHEQWAPYLAREHGIALEFEPFESPELSALLYEPGRLGAKARLVVRDFLRRWARRHRALSFDGVVILREASLLGGAWLESYFARRGVPLVYDFDDAIWLWERAGANGFMSLARMPWKVKQICRLASAVTVGNHYLANYARRYNDNVHIVRTSIELARYPVLPFPSTNGDGPFTIAWTGSHSTLAHLNGIRPALEELGRRISTRLRVICDAKPEPFDNVELDFVRWSPQIEASALGVAHVGIMPLPDTPSTHGKCGCKALQYMAVGRPAIVSPVGINCVIVHDDENGAYAATTEQWIAQLERFANDRELQRRLGAAGRATVERGYTAEASARAFARVVQDAFAVRAQSHGRVRHSSGERRIAPLPV